MPVTALWYEVFHRQDAGHLMLAVTGSGATLALYARLLWQNLMRRTAPGL